MHDKIAEVNTLLRI